MLNISIQILQRMGAVKSMAHMLTYNEYLYYYINKGDLKNIEDILKLRPNLISDPITPHTKTTALNRACYNGKPDVIKLLVEKYEADINLPSQKGETPLISAVKRKHLDVVKYLLNKGANPDYVDKAGFKAIDYAILPGYYEIAQIIYCESKDKEIKSGQEYEQISKKYHYRYVDYEGFLEQMKAMVQFGNTKDFLEKKKDVLSDPVIDPRESWSEWFVRNLDFRDPPMVERNSLPEELRPENRRFGKLTHFLGKVALTPASQKPSYKPSHSQNQDTRNHLKEEKMELQSIS